MLYIYKQQYGTWMYMGYPQPTVFQGVIYPTYKRDNPRSSDCFKAYSPVPKWWPHIEGVDHLTIT